MKRILVLLALASAPLLHAQTDPTFAWAANAGWVNFNPGFGAGGAVGDFYCMGRVWAANVGWIDLGSGAPGNGYAYANNSAGDFGVNQDGLGNFSGYAYGANVGWIDFGWAGLNDPNRPRFSLLTGSFQGYAYSANVGWINLGAGYLQVPNLTRIDADGDGIDDAWEMQWFASLRTAGIGTDFDGDGQSDAAESIADTDPTNRNDFLKIVSHTYASGVTTVTIQFTSSPARLYRLERKADLAAGTWTDSGLGTFAPEAGATTSRAFSFPSSSRQFFRVVAVLPLG